mgnify:FL=1
MKTGLVITTINQANKNIKNIDINCNSKKWDFCIIGDKKTPKKFKLRYGNYLDINLQKKLNFKFSNICPLNSYSRKNIGYLVLAENKNDFIVETDDDNYPKRIFFQKRYLSHNVKKILNNSWINIYKYFLLSKNNFIWPRGLPLDQIDGEEIILSKKKLKKNFPLQQSVCDLNPDVDAIYRMYKKKINIKFKNKKINIGQSITPFNSQNTTWHVSLLPLMYLPVTCTMRATDIWRSFIALRILKLNSINILFNGPSVFQKRNHHNLIVDFKDEASMYINNKKIMEILNQTKLKRGFGNLSTNLVLCYEALIKNGFFEKKEFVYLKAWVKDCQNIKLI